MTTLVQQRTPYDCAIACFAMVTGCTYEDVLSVLGDLFDPVKGLSQQAEALRRFGLSSKFENGAPVGDFVNMHRDWCIAPMFLRQWVWGRRALITVPSQNIVDGWHFVYYDGHDVFDPSLGKTYKALSELLPEAVVLFREHRSVGGV